MGASSCLSMHIIYLRLPWLPWLCSITYNQALASWGKYSGSPKDSVKYNCQTGDLADGSLPFQSLEAFLPRRGVGPTINININKPRGRFEPTNTLAWTNQDMKRNSPKCDSCTEHWVYSSQPSSAIWPWILGLANTWLFHRWSDPESGRTKIMFFKQWWVHVGTKQSTSQNAHHQHN